MLDELTTSEQLALFGALVIVIGLGNVVQGRMLLRFLVPAMGRLVGWFEQREHRTSRWTQRAHAADHAYVRHMKRVYEFMVFAGRVIAGLGVVLVLVGIVAGLVG